jgi:hypothetical protein
MKMYRADNDAASVEQSELTVRSICPDVDITGVETIEMKHVAEGNRIRSYVLVALPLGSKNVAKSARDIQNRSGEAFKELDNIAKDPAGPAAIITPVAPAVQQVAPAQVEQLSKAPAAVAPVPAPIPLTANPNTPNSIDEPAKAERTPAPLSPSSTRPIVAPATKLDGSVLESVKAVGNDTVIVQGANGADKQVGLIGAKNPEYLARRAEALQKPGAVIGQISIE